MWVGRADCYLLISACHVETIFLIVCIIGSATSFSAEPLYSSCLGCSAHNSLFKSWQAVIVWWARASTVVVGMWHGAPGYHANIITWSCARGVQVSKGCWLFRCSRLGSAAGLGASILLLSRQCGMGFEQWSVVGFMNLCAIRVQCCFEVIFGRPAGTIRWHLHVIEYG